MERLLEGLAQHVHDPEIIRYRHASDGSIEENPVESATPSQRTNSTNFGRGVSGILYLSVHFGLIGDPVSGQPHT